MFTGLALWVLTPSTGALVFFLMLSSDFLHGLVGVNMSVLFVTFSACKVFLWSTLGVVRQDTPARLNLRRCGTYGSVAISDKTLSTTALTAPSCARVRAICSSGELIVLRRSFRTVLLKRPHLPVLPSVIGCWARN